MATETERRVGMDEAIHELGKAAVSSLREAIRRSLNASSARVFDAPISPSTTEMRSSKENERRSPILKFCNLSLVTISWRVHNLRVILELRLRRRRRRG